MSQDSRFLLESVLEQSRKQDYPALKPDKFFELFSAQQVLKARRYNPDPVEVESGIIGGGGDGGVDGFYLFVNRRFVREDTDPGIFKDQQLTVELVVVQAKNKPSFEESVPQKLLDFTERCLRLNADTSTQRLLYSEALLTLVRKFHDIYKPALAMRPRLTISFFHVSLSDQVDKKVEARATILVNRTKDFFPTAECTYELVRGNKLLELFQQQPERRLSLPTPKYFDWKSFDRNAYVCVVKLADLYTFITDNGALREYLFEANVRDHAPDVRVNKGIRATLAASAGDDFWWLNNGITILASEVSYHDGALHLTDPCIVNGLQTSHELFSHFSAGASTDDARTIMVKVIANTNTDTSDRIINATNSQTKIEAINLHATEQIHRNIEAALRTAGLFYDRRKNFYRNKGVPATQIITIAYMAQAIAAIVLQQPDNARARPTTVAEKNYKALFSESHPVALYPKCAQIMKRVDLFLEERGIERGLKLNLIFYLAMHATCVSLKSARPQRTRIAALDLGTFNDDLLQECYDVISDEYKKLGGEDRVAKGPQLTERLRQILVHEYGKGKRNTLVKVQA